MPSRAPLLTMVLLCIGQQRKYAEQEAARKAKHAKERESREIERQKIRDKYNLKGAGRQPAKKASTSAPAPAAAAAPAKDDSCSVM